MLYGSHEPQWQALHLGRLGGDPLLGDPNSLSMRGPMEVVLWGARPIMAEVICAEGLRSNGDGFSLPPGILCNKTKARAGPQCLYLGTGCPGGRIPGVRLSMQSRERKPAGLWGKSQVLWGVGGPFG